MIVALRPYPSYVDSGVPWLGMVPEHWKIKPLKRWVRMNARVLPESTDPDYQFRYLDIGSVGTGTLTAEPQRLRFVNAPSRARRALQYGDTIVSTVRTYLKAVYFVSGDCRDLIASTGFAALTPKDDVDPRYLSFLAQSSTFTDRVSAYSVGTAYPAIAEGKLGSLHIAMPTLPEQSAIVRFLDHADRRIRRYIRARRRLIALLNEQKEALIHRAVTRGLDPNVRLKPSGVEWLGEVPEDWDVCSLRHRYSVHLGKMLDAKRITGEHPVPYLRNVDVQWDRINVQELPTMDIAPHEHARYTLQPGDMLVCEGGEVGRAAFWHGALPQCGYQKALHRLCPLDPARDQPRFLFYVMHSTAKQGVFVADGSENTIAHLTGVKLRRHRFAFPPKPTQQAIAAFLDNAVAALDEAVGRARKEIDLIREYRTRLIADVVTGKLDAREAAACLPEESEEAEDDLGRLDQETANEVDREEGDDALPTQ